MIEHFWINGRVVYIPSGWDYVEVDGDVFKRTYNANGHCKWELV